MKIEIEELQKGYIIKIETTIETLEKANEVMTKRIAVTNNRDLIEELKQLLGYTEIPKKTYKPRTRTEAETQKEPYRPYRRPPQSSLLIDAFEYDPKQTKKFKNLSYFEHEDGRIMLSYIGSHYYMTKQKLETIPRPIPKGYLKDKGLSTNAQTAIRLYMQQQSLKQIADTTEHKTTKPRKETPFGEQEPALSP